MNIGKTNESAARFAIVKRWEGTGFFGFFGELGRAEKRGGDCGKDFSGKGTH